MDERRPLMPGKFSHYQWEKRAFNEPPRDGVLGQTNGGICLSQLMQQLDELNLRRQDTTSKDTGERCANLGEKYSKIFLPLPSSACDRSCRSATCSSPLEPTLFQGQLQRHEPDLRRYQTLRSWSHPPRRKYHGVPQNNERDGSGVALSEMRLRITPAVVTHSHGLRDRRENGRGTRNMVLSPYCLAQNRSEGPGAEMCNSSTAQSSRSTLFMDFPSDDSDLSDQERTTVSAKEWATPVELNLRPESFDPDDPEDHSESRDDVFPYAEFLPAPLKILDLTQNLLSGEDWERRRSLIGLDPSLFVLADRLAEMEKLEAATVHKERTKAGWSRSATAIGMTRSAVARPRKADVSGPQPDSFSSGTDPGGEWRSDPHGPADLAPPRTPTARRRPKTARARSRQSRDARGSAVSPVPPRQAHPGSNRPIKSSCLPGQSVQALFLSVAPSSFKVERSKGSRKVTSSLKRKSSSNRKKTTRADRRL